jgi:predicted flap endonuclease-1-like 5' DNA nuclease
MNTMAQDEQDNLRNDYREFGRLYGFGWLGVLVILAFLAVGVVAYYGYTGPGLFTIESAVAGLAAGLFIVTFALLVVLFSVRSIVARGRDQAAQVAILRAQTYAHGLEMQHEQKPHEARLVEQEPQFVEQVVVNVETQKKANRAPLTTALSAPRNAGGWSVEELEGIGEAFASRLRAQGIVTVDDLRAARVAKIAQAADVNEYIASHWRAMAELCTVPEIGPQEAELLARTGVHNPRVLAHHEPRTLYAACRYVIESRKNKIYPNVDFSEDLVRQWINAARIHVRQSMKQARASTTSTTGPAAVQGA